MTIKKDEKGAAMMKLGKEGKLTAVERRDSDRKRNTPMIIRQAKRSSMADEFNPCTYDGTTPTRVFFLVVDASIIYH